MLKSFKNKNVKIHPPQIVFELWKNWEYTKEAVDRPILKISTTILVAIMEPTMCIDLLSVQQDQCDQMPRMFAQYLAININVSWQKNALNFPK